jgi:hypothetical protein
LDDLDLEEEEEEECFLELWWWWLLDGEEDMLALGSESESTVGWGRFDIRGYIGGDMEGLVADVWFDVLVSLISSSFPGVSEQTLFKGRWRTVS